MTPYCAIFGHDPPQILRYTPAPNDEVIVSQQLQERDMLLDQLKHNFHRSQQRIKAYANGKRKEVKLAVGDYVFVKLQPYRQISLASRKNQKLSMKYFGLFPVLERIGPLAYKLQLPVIARIHPIFHISFF